MDEDARRAALERHPRPDRRRVRDRIVAEARGNPLALLELPRGMSAVDLAGGFEVPAVADLPGRLEGHYLRRVEALPEATQRLLLLAAADPVGDAALVWRAAGHLGIGADVLRPAEDAELLTIGARVRSAIRWCAPPYIERRRRPTGERSTGRWRRRPMRTVTPIVALGIVPRPRQDSTRRSPTSSSAARIVRGHAADSPQPRRSCGARSS